ncbi:MAG: DUF1232 domain-containing protein [Nitrospirota bacterium]|nr:MAG: DUF1232 domain-containing protein [Nitrospirota bacterium]
MSDTRKKTIKKGRSAKAVKKKRAQGKTDKKKVDERNARNKIEKKARRISDKDVRELIDKEEEIGKKLSRVPGGMEKLVNRLRLLYEMTRDYWKGNYKEIPWYSIAMAVAALLYFLNPFDIIMDIVPGIGYVDDVLVIGLVFKSINEDLRKYCSVKGYDPEMYF